jgi:hypothetical protein
MQLPGEAELAVGCRISAVIVLGDSAIGENAGLPHKELFLILGVRVTHQPRVAQDAVPE